MSINNLTNRKFWKEYWSNHKYGKIPSKVPFNKVLPRLKKAQKEGGFIEIGGFPGVFAGYFYTQGYKSVSLLDFYIDEDIVRRFEEANSIPRNTIICIESDFFTFNTNKKYDIVFSYGFIEHFEDTKDVIRRHVELLSEDNGRLLIVLPNFRGLNGLVQYIFDRKNLRAHNLNSMNLKSLRNISIELGLKNVIVEYTRKPMLWLEPDTGSIFFHKIIKLFSYALKLFPIKCRLLSPYIIIFAEK